MKLLSERSTFWATLVAVLLFLPVLWAVGMWRSAAAAADGSAHEAIMFEIFDQLAAIPSGQPYPASLSELRLTFPDGGDHSLLSRFEYHSTGTGCTVKTTVWGNEFKRSFPADKDRPHHIP